MQAIGEVAKLYDDPLFFPLAVGTSLVSLGSFLLFAVPMTIIAWRDPPSLRKYRIQSRRPRKQALVGPSLAWLVINNAIQLGVFLLAWPLLRKTGIHGGPLPPWYVIVAEVVFFVYLDDGIFYWIHRKLHEGWLYKKVHSLHHRILTPWAITGHYMHPAEYMLIGTLALLGPVLVSAHLVTLWIWVALRQWEAADAHSGYDFPWTPMRLFPGSDGAVHHDFHHAKVKGNYASFLSHMDRWFGTFARDYGEDRKRRGRD